MDLSKNQLHRIRQIHCRKHSENDRVAVAAGGAAATEAMAPGSSRPIKPEQFLHLWVLYRNRRWRTQNQVNRELLAMVGESRIRWDGDRGAAAEVAEVERSR